MASLVSATLVHALVLGALGGAGRVGSAPAQALALQIIARPAKADGLPAPPDADPPSSARLTPGQGGDELRRLPADSVADGDNAQAQPAQTAPAAPTSDEPADSWPDFIAAAQLSQPPSTAGPVRIPFPDVDTSFGVCQLVVVLYIDEAGQLVEIGTAGQALAAAFLHAVNKGLGSAVFAPGRIGDTAVKARLRVRVTFDGTRLTTAHQNADL